MDFLYLFIFLQNIVNEDAVDVVKPYIGDDELYDDLYAAGKKNPKGDARPAIRDALQRFDLPWEEEVELEEGKMSDLHQLIKDKKSAEEIAKIMKLDVKTIKSLMSSYESTDSDTMGENGKYMEMLAAEYADFTNEQINERVTNSPIQGIIDF